MRSEFEDQLNDLHVRFAEMSMMVNETIKKSVNSFLNHDKKMAQQVIDDDQKINNREMDLEKRSFELIALQQPVTTDLRMIVTVLKASSDLERMGDHSVSVARATLEMKDVERIPAVEKQIKEVAQEVERTFSEAIDAYIRNDDHSAIDIAKNDDNIDKMIGKINRTCIEAMKDNKETVEGGTSYILVANYIERMGDYVTNLCEWIVYLKRGKLYDLNTKNPDAE